MSSFKSHFLYDKRKRNGILFFCALILGYSIFLGWYEPDVKVVSIDPEAAEQVALLQAEIDSLKAVKMETSGPVIYPFNPNFLTDYRGDQLGMSITEIDNLLRFRESGHWINSAADFQKVTGVSDSILSQIEPYFKFPDWVNASKKTTDRQRRSWKTTAEKSDLNSITYVQLLAIDSIDSIAADKILRHIQSIGGYQMDGQIYDVYGVTSTQKRAVLDAFTVKTKPAITYINVNAANASDLATIPLLNYDLALEIIDYRTLNEGIGSLEELRKLEGMTDYKYDRISLYLSLK